MSPVALALLPSLEHRELAVGPYAVDSLATPGLEVLTRHVDDTGNQMDLRMMRMADGSVQLDRFELESMALTVRVRPNLGDQVAIGLCLGSWDQVWLSHNGARAQARLYSPMTLSGVGFSRTTDDPEVFRYTATAGTGVGGEVLAKVVGPIGVQLKGDVQASALRRAGAEHYTTRQEVAATAEVGLAVLARRQAWILGAWAEMVTQWEPWDLEGRDGVDREYWAAGARLSGRFYDPPSLDLPVETRWEEGDFEVDLNRDWEEAPEPTAPPKPQARGPVEVHWSELVVLTEVVPAWPADAPADALCSVVFEVDATGTPTDVRPDRCEATLLPAVMEAAWAFRFEPLSEGGIPVAARFLYTFTPPQGPSEPQEK